MNIDENYQKEELEVKLTDKEIFTQIWTTPRLVFKYLHEKNYDKFVTILLIFAGISRAFNRASTKNMGDEMPLLVVIGFCIVFGGLVGWVAIYIYAALLSWTGKWLKGQADTKSLLRVIAHGLIPSIVSLLLLIPQIAIFGNGIFQSDIDIFSRDLDAIIIFYTTLFFEISLGIWSIVIIVIGISEVQKITIAKSVLNVILPGLVILGPIMVIAFIVGSLS